MGNQTNDAKTNPAGSTTTARETATINNILLQLAIEEERYAALHGAPPEYPYENALIFSPVFQAQVQDVVTHALRYPLRSVLTAFGILAFEAGRRYGYDNGFLAGFDNVLDSLLTITRANENLPEDPTDDELLETLCNGAEILRDSELVSPPRAA